MMRQKTDDEILEDLKDWPVRNIYVERGVRLIEQLRQRVAELEDERDAALETIKQQHRIHVELVEEKEVAEAKADEEQKHSCKMAYQRDFANVEITTLKSALNVARGALEYYVPMIKQGDSPAEEAIAKINEVLK